MKYYIMSQDKRMQHHIQFREFPGEKITEVGTDMTGKIKKNLTLHVKDDGHTVFTDVVEAPFFMVSDEVAKVIGMFEPDIDFFTIIFQTKHQEEVCVYKIVPLDRMECLHKNTEFHKDKSLKELVLDKEKIQGKHIFKIAGISPHYVVVSMAIAESILRRNCEGIQFTEVKIV